MSTTSPSNIFYPDADSQYNLVADLAAMAQSIQNALNLQANAHYGTDSERIAYTGRAKNGTLWANSDGDLKTYQFRNGRWYPDYEFVPLLKTGPGNFKQVTDFAPDPEYPLGVHVTSYGRMAVLSGRMIQTAKYKWDKNAHKTLGYIPTRVAPATNLNNLSSVWSSQDSRLTSMSIAIRGVASTPGEAGRVRASVRDAVWRNQDSDTGASLEVPGITWFLSDPE